MNGPVLMLFLLSTGFVPVEGFPGWLQPVVRANPLSAAVETLIGLSAGGPILVPALQTAAWIAVLTGLLAPSAVRRYRTLAASLRSAPRTSGWSCWRATRTAPRTHAWRPRSERRRSRPGRCSGGRAASMQAVRSSARSG